MNKVLGYVIGTFEDIYSYTSDLKDSKQNSTIIKHTSKPKFYLNPKPDERHSPACHFYGGLILLF